MKEKEIEKKFKDAINEDLKAGGNNSELIYNNFLSSYGKNDDVKNFLYDCYKLYLEASNPQNFYTKLILDPNSKQFNEVYNLMLNLFESNVTEEEEWYKECLKKTIDGKSKSPYILIVRYFRVYGDQKYDLKGNLIKFGTNRNIFTEKIVSFISGNYMPLTNSKEAIGAIGHVATLEKFRRQNHASELIRVFLNECNEYANKRGEKLVGLVGEVEDDAKDFFYRCGFRWPKNVYYAQPPLRFDPKTGEKNFYEVPEHLMILSVDKQKRIKKDTLINVVRALYHYWVIKKHAHFNKDVKRKIAYYVWRRVFKDFLNSVSCKSNYITLVKPLPSVILFQNNKFKINIRKLTLNEIEEFKKIIFKIFDPYSQQKILDSLDSFEEKIPFLDYEYLVITNYKNKVIGLSGMYAIRYSTGGFNPKLQNPIVARLNWFGILPNFRRKGIGYWVLKMTENFAKRRGVQIFCIETSNNPIYDTARKLYQKAGYRLDKCIPNYFGAGKPLRHYYIESSEVKNILLLPKWEIKPLNEKELKKIMELSKILFREDSYLFEKCLEDYFFQRQYFLNINQQENLPIFVDFFTLQKSKEIIGVFGIARYLWISSDAYWIRWFKILPNFNPAQLIKVCIFKCIEMGARMIIFEVSEKQDAKVLEKMGFRTGKTIPDVYLSKDEWISLLQLEYNQKLITKEQFKKAIKKPNLFYLYYKFLKQKT